MMHQELFGSSAALQSCTLRPVRSPVVFRQRRSAVRTLAARRGAKQEEEEKPQNFGLFGGLTSRIGAGSKQKAEPGTEKVGRKQRAPAAAKPERKQKPEPASGTQKIKGGPLSFFGGRKDANTVFVAGGSGRLGARIVRELLNRGFKVRVGVRDQAQGDTLLKTAINYGLITAEAGKKAQIVEFDLLDEATIGPAIGNASKVVSAIGAAEAKPFDVGAPKRIDGDAAIRLVNVAAQSGVEQFTMVTALGTGKFGWPASVLNLFWGILVWKKQAEEALQASGMQYTIVRPGGMEKPRDDHKLTHNVILGQRDSTFGGTVSRLQVAELIGAALSEPSLAANKVLEVWSEKTAPAADYESLLRAQPNERASDEENATAAQAVSAVEPGKGLKRQRTQKYAAPRTPGQPAAPTLPKAQPGPPPPKPQAAAAATATPAAPPKPKNPAEIRREEERQQELERQRQWQADQEAQRAANQIPSQQPKPRDLEAEAQEQKARAARNEEYARNRMATEARVQAEAEQERRSAREKENARREAEKQKRLQAADKESSAQKQAEQQLLAQNKVSKVITPPGTNKLSSAEQDLGSAQPSKKLPGAEQGKGEKKPPAPKPAPAAAASKPSSSAGASPEQAKKNAEEAARWISNWRSNGAGSNGASSNGSSNGASASKTTSAASSNGSSNGSSPSSKGSAQAVKGKAR